METLRTCIRILFSRRRPESLLINTDRGEVALEKDKFARFYQQYFPELTLDQCLVSADMAEQYYMAPPERYSQMKSYRKRCVMNILLHFSKEVLIEDAGYPVCRFEHLLRWHSMASFVGEDLLTTSFLASKDEDAGVDRSDFDWPIAIAHDDVQVNNLFTRKMADIHMHLKGSSGNFDLNWLALMNHVANRGDEFKDLQTSQQPSVVLENAGNGQPSLYAFAVLAAMIRVFLFKIYCRKVSFKDDDSLTFIAQNLEVEDVMLPFLADKVDDIVAGERLMKQVNADTLPIYDYVSNPTKDYIMRNPAIVLSCERKFMYSCFRECYGGRMSADHVVLFYKYLLIKNKIRNELVQSNAIVGFKNFDTYDRRKAVFMDNYPEYKSLVEPLALGLYFYTGVPRLVEARIAPKDSLPLLHDAVKDIEKRVNRRLEDGSDYGYVIHFIKEEDKNKGTTAVARHASIRDKVRKQAYYIAEFRQRSSLADRIYGIDAANSEILARPEVFAQAFRYLRGERFTDPDNKAKKNLGMTYHVGEDFMSMLDGLRAVDEVIHYMRFERGCRLGHAIILGVDPEKYLSARHKTLLLKKHTLLDNLAWAVVEYDGDGNGNRAMAAIKYMKDTFRSVYRDVYGSEASDGTIRTYYDSWLLRGDNPERYLSIVSAGNSDVYLGPLLTRWSHYDFNDDAAANDARNNEDARTLYYRYHYDDTARVKGDETISYQCPAGTVDVLKSLQEKVYGKVQRLGIGIESNPTSNVRIGGIVRYVDHPIFKFLPVMGGENSVLASINTDDRGVFDTSLEREFSLLACALYKKHNHDSSQPDMRKTMVWLDELRENAIMQYFGN